MFNVVTIAREYGSGGADIGRKVADLLGWQCIDKEIIERVATRGKVDLSWVAKQEEQAIAWWERVMKSFRHAGISSFVGDETNFGVDRDVLQQFTANVIQEAAKVGNCVIIGRSAQCVLHHEPRVLRVLVYAPLKEKIERMKLRHPEEKNIEALLRRVDSERIYYARYYYDCDSQDPRLYQLCMNSHLGLDFCARLIVQTVNQQPDKI